MGTWEYSKKSPKSVAKHKLFQISDIPPTKKTKKNHPPENENTQQIATKKKKKSPVITAEIEDQPEYSICLNRMYKEDSLLSASPIW